MLLDQFLLLLLKLPDCLVHFDFLFVEARLLFDSFVQRPPKGVCVMYAINHHSHEADFLLESQPLAIFAWSHADELLENDVHRCPVRTKVLTTVLHIMQKNEPCDLRPHLVFVFNEFVDRLKDTVFHFFVGCRELQLLSSSC